MPVKISELKPLKGTSRFLFRFPIWIYRARLGWMMGTRFVLLTHTGRKSGRERQNVLEIVRYDPEDGSCYVASGWGNKSDWYRNISAHPQVKFQIGNIERIGIAERISTEQAGNELLDYSRRHPLAMRELAHFMGFEVNGTAEDIQALGEMIPLFHIIPLPINQKKPD